MNIIKIAIYCCCLTLLGTNVSCANNDVDQKSISRANSERPESNASFRLFHEQYIKAINRNDWQALADLTKFPFTFRGQLDSEGEIQVSKQEFLRLFPRFLKLEAFFDVQGESIPTTYRVLATTPVGENDVVKDERVEMEDFVFAKEAGKWKFIQVYTDLSNITQIRE